ALFQIGRQSQAEGLGRQDAADAAPSSRNGRSAQGPEGNGGNLAMTRPDHGIVKDEKGQEQPADKDRAQTVHKADPDKSVSREATRDPKLDDAEKTPRSG